jgi:hypothetical protein
MPLYKDSYSTTVGSVQNTQPIVTSLIKAFIKDGLDTVNLDVRNSGDVKPVFVIGSFSSEAEIPLFAHPIMISDSHRGKTLCTDLRYFVREGTGAWEVEKGIRNLTEYNFAKSRAVLNLLWVSDRVGEIRNGLAFAGVVYASLLSESIAKANALDFKDLTKVQIASHFFYQTLFSEKTEFDEEEKQRMAAHTIKATGAPAEEVMSVIDKLPAMHNLNDFCEALVNVVESVRLKGFNLAMMLTLLKNSWYGHQSKEIMSVALEHPPTWCAMVYTALQERTYRNSMVYRVADAKGKRGASAEFLKSYSLIVREQINKREVISAESVQVGLEELSAVKFD